MKGLRYPARTAKRAICTWFRISSATASTGSGSCTECHKDITEIPHKTGITHKVSCVSCHEELWDKAKKENKTEENAKLGVVAQQIDKFMKSDPCAPQQGRPVAHQRDLLQLP